MNTPNVDTQPAVHIAQRGHVTHIDFSNGPHNHVNLAALQLLADTLDQCDGDPECRAIVLTTAGRIYCAGANFNSGTDPAKRDPDEFYAQALRLFDTRKPLVTAIQGPAIGAGLGLALAADFRVAAATSKFSANFNRLGLHPGFGMSHTLPRLVGAQHASRLFYTGARIDSQAAFDMGLVDQLSSDEQVREDAFTLATNIAQSAPLAVAATRDTLRMGLAAAVQQANAREREQQKLDFQTLDFREGVAASAARREPAFVGR